MNTHHFEPSVESHSFFVLIVWLSMHLDVEMRKQAQFSQSGFSNHDLFDFGVMHCSLKLVASSESHTFFHAFDILLESPAAMNFHMCLLLRRGVPRTF